MVGLEGESAAIGNGRGPEAPLDTETGCLPKGRPKTHCKLTFVRRWRVSARLLYRHCFDSRQGRGFSGSTARGAPPSSSWSRRRTGRSVKIWVFPERHHTSRVSTHDALPRPKCWTGLFWERYEGCDSPPGSGRFLRKPAGRPAARREKPASGCRGFPHRGTDRSGQPPVRLLETDAELQVGPLARLPRFTQAYR